MPPVWRWLNEVLFFLTLFSLLIILKFAVEAILLFLHFFFSGKLEKDIGALSHIHCLTEVKREWALCQRHFWHKVITKLHQIQKASEQCYRISKGKMNSNQHFAVADLLEVSHTLTTFFSPPVHTDRARALGCKFFTMFVYCGELSEVTRHSDNG